ncbi:MAG: hypothetical protein JRE16_07080 [Deltaproteobacteria bacterium]|nr:hypothetical protein [Deltaproteobacteria bacterium]
MTVSLRTSGAIGVPFGMINGHMVSDPVTLDLGRTQGIAAMFGLEADLCNVQVASFNGAVDTDRDYNTIDNWLVSLNFLLADTLLFGLTFLSDLCGKGDQFGSK